MKNYFPPTDKSYTYLQTNRSDSLGSLWSTMGIDLQSSLNTLRVASRTLVAANTAALSNLLLPIAFVFFNSNLWAVAGTRLFRTSTSPGTGWAEDTATDARTDYGSDSDLEVFEGDLFATTEDELVKSTGGSSWVTVEALAPSVIHVLSYFPFFNRLYYTYDASNVRSIDIAGNISDGSYELNLEDTSYGQISCMVSSSTSVWLGTNPTGFSEGDGTGYILQWDGINAGLTKSYPMTANAVLAMCVYKDIVYAMDSNGILQRFNGYTFEEIGRLPFVNKIPGTGFIGRNGLIPTKNGTILALINNLNSGSTASYQENIASGVWEWSEDFGFTHKFALSYTPAGTLSSITDFGQNQIFGAGALYNVSDLFPNVSGRNGSILIGAGYYTNASTATSGIFIDDLDNTVIKKGYAVSTWFFSQEIQDKWTRLWATYRRLLTANDSIVFKYRTSEVDPLYADITWVNTTSFTTTTNPSAYWQSPQSFGGEVEVLQGTGSGSCAHITNIVNNAGTYTVTLDTPITGVTTGTAKVRFQAWIKLLPATAQEQINSWEQYQIGASDIRIQLKVCCTFTGNGEFYKFAMFSNEDIKVTA